MSRKRKFQDRQRSNIVPYSDSEISDEEKSLVRSIKRQKLKKFSKLKEHAMEFKKIKKNTLMLKENKEKKVRELNDEILSLDDWVD